jgi:hypothetical protein
VFVGLQPPLLVEEDDPVLLAVLVPAPVLVEDDPVLVPAPVLVEDDPAPPPEDDPPEPVPQPPAAIAATAKRIDAVMGITPARRATRALRALFSEHSFIVIAFQCRTLTCGDGPGGPQTRESHDSAPSWQGRSLLRP